MVLWIGLYLLSTPEAHERWYSPGDGWVVVERVYEFRVGGRQHSRFGPPGQPIHHSEGWFADIVPNERIVSAWATSAGIAQYLLDQQVYGLPENYYQRYPHNVAVVSLGAVNAEAEALIGVRPLTWVVAGDRAKIEAGIRGLALGKLQVIDVDGRLMQ